jgi:ribosomal protein S27AE
LSALATAPRLFPAAPGALDEARRAARPAGPLTLEERLDRELGATLAGRSSTCPACGGAMTATADARARCGGCGSVLS